MRNSAPVAPEDSALADDLRSNLKGKPTRSGFNRSWFSEMISFFADILKIVVVLVLCACFALGGFGSGMLLGYVSTTKPLSISDLTQTEEAQTSFVYDSEGNVIAKLTGNENVDRIYVPIGDIKDTYIDEAIISIEDERFYDHSGIDIRRIGSAVLSALLNGGTATYGGSTITQQTVKLISGQDQHSTSRKVQEWFSAMSLEQDLSKDEIMELYINLAPMGNNYVGVQSAAQNYFGKDAADLNLAECALLAGLPKSPSYYNPLRESGRRNALRRMRIVLSKMYELGHITEEEYQEALNTEIVFKTQETTSSNDINSYFAEYAIQEVINDLTEARNISSSLATTIVYNRGYHIYTTLEPDVQSVVDEAFMNRDLFQTDPTLLFDLPEKPQAGMVVINVQTGAIAAMQGGYGQKTVNLGLNRAVSAYRSPGSSIKPILDYAPALELQLITPATVFNDQESHFDPNNPDMAWPLNADRSYAGPMTIRRAITLSKNTIAVAVWYEVSGDTALWFLSREGIDRLDEGSYPAQAIGAFTKGMTPLEMCGAYNTLASGGTYTEPYAYTSVVDNAGNVVLQCNPETHRVYSQETAFLISDMLEDVITEGTAAGNASIITNDDGEYIATAGKTGTTDDNLDKWFCGYTPYYCAAVWYGYDNRLRQTVIPSGDRSNAIRIWYYVMSRIHGDCESMAFEMPDDIIQVEVCSSGYYATEYCREEGTTMTDYFIEGSYLTPTSDNPCPIHEESDDDDDEDEDD
ncbi:MAG: PBP1A family penicillin-binding protein [Clostridiales bacterium]|nr:PBP1A family penicillin-binding protein [Clostridiales bacterium]MBR6483524.1 PBP1A family penicillin-binding protein [Clostridiales bacterium]